MQTDPVGYTDDLNLYAYVGNDPMDKTDPAGLYTTSCDAADKKCNAAADEFEKQRQVNLTSKDANVMASAQAYGDRGQVNGVSVNFLSDKEFDAKNGRDAVGETHSTYVGSTATTTVDVREKLTGRDMRATSAHEGTHVAQRAALAASYNSQTHKYDAHLNDTRRDTERQAYYVESAIHNRFSSQTQVDSFLNSNYSAAKLDQTLIDPSYTQ